MQGLEQLVLASSSQWRLAMLQDAGLDVIAMAPLVDEDRFSDPNPALLAEQLAHEKAMAVFKKCPGRLVLGADQVAHIGDEVFGKPKDPGDHLRRLQQLRGTRHDLVTGVSMLDASGEERFHVRTGIYFRDDISDEELVKYVDCGEGSGCAGGYRIEGRGAWLIDRVDGDWFNVVGLPLLEVVGRLRRKGWRF